MKKLFSTLFAVVAMMIMVSCGGANNSAAEDVQAKVEAEGYEALTAADIDVALDYMEGVVAEIKPYMEEIVTATIAEDEAKMAELEQEMKDLEAKYPLADAMGEVLENANLTDAQQDRYAEIVSSLMK